MFKNLLEQVIDIKNISNPKTFTVLSKKKECQDFIGLTKNKKPLFLLVIGSTETALVPGLSAAGKNIEQLKLTPALDADFLLLKKEDYKKNIPVSPDGIPSPVIISKAICEMLDLDITVVDAGAFVKPFVKHISLNMGQGKSLSGGQALGPIKTDFLFQKGEKLASSLTNYPYIVLGECVPGGTTTALAILCALGINAFDLVSSSFPEGNHFWKNQIVKEALLKDTSIYSKIRKTPLKVCEYFGDPTQPFISGFIKGASNANLPVLLAGGSQMVAIYYLAKQVLNTVPKNIVLGTTSWIIGDKNARTRRLAELVDAPLMYSNTHFKNSRFNGLLAYESGHIKEGVGAGGLMIAAELYKDVLQDEINTSIEGLYEYVEKIILKNNPEK